MKGAWKKEPILETHCTIEECGQPIRVYRAKRETTRRRLRQSVNQHCLRYHSGMSSRERSLLSDRIAEAEGY